MLSFSYSNKEFTYFLPTLKSEPSNAQNALCRPTNENLYPIICNLLALLCQVHVKQDIPQPNCMAFLWALIVLGKYLSISLTHTRISLLSASSTWGKTKQNRWLFLLQHAGNFQNKCNGDGPAFSPVNLLVRCWALLGVSRFEVALNTNLSGGDKYLRQGLQRQPHLVDNLTLSSQWAFRNIWWHFWLSQQWRN